jgi:hypothetical protein
MGSTTDALPRGVVRTLSGFWPWRLLCRRWLLWTHRPSTGQRSFGIGNRIVQNSKLDHPVSQEAAIALGHQQG